ncbi:YafQ toxin protein [Candidatus Burkholderia humilis]|nr:YafQ toxin protein [Candidatus Burkholderia humilis]
MIVEWHPRAPKRLRQIYEYIEEHNPHAAEDIFRQVSEAVMTLAESPRLYRLGRIEGTREMIVHPNYLVVYSVTDRVTVLNVLHTRRRFPLDEGFEC